MLIVNVHVTWLNNLAAYLYRFSFCSFVFFYIKVQKKYLSSRNATKNLAISTPPPKKKEDYIQWHKLSRKRKPYDRFSKKFEVLFATLFRGGKNWCIVFVKVLFFSFEC